MTLWPAAERPRLPPAYRLVALDSVASTNEEAARLAAEGAEDGTLVWARRQTAGRGRQGRDWESPAGNLYLSLVLRPDCAVNRAAQLGFAAALAVGDAVGSVGPAMLEITYKWPNDVLLNDRKVAGILLESRTAGAEVLDWLVLGVGVNVASHPKEARYPATDLKFEGASPAIDEVDLLESFSRHFMSWTNSWLDDGFAPLRRAWLSHAHALGEEIEARLPRETLRGIFRDIDEHGALILELQDGTRRVITAGDIYDL